MKKGLENNFNKVEVRDKTPKELETKQLKPHGHSIHKYNKVYLLFYFSTHLHFKFAL